MFVPHKSPRYGGGGPTSYNLYTLWFIGAVLLGKSIGLFIATPIDVIVKF